VKAALEVQASGRDTLEPLLEIADSVMTYRRRYFSQPQWPPAIDLLLADETNPRSLAFQVIALDDHVANLPQGQDSRQHARHTEVLRTILNNADWPTLAHAQLTAGGNELDALLAQVAAGLRGLSDSLTHQYFSHATTRVS
jgi:uncharacterized alpha-E superfamily protein